jgi:sensor histidine kinase YesM
MGPRLDILPLLAVLTAFWIYVTLSNVLYAHSMQAGFASLSSKHLFAPWLPRVLQHLILYPVLIGAVCASLRVGWQPIWRAVPMQLLLGLVFSAVATPALNAGEMIQGIQEQSPHGTWSLSGFLAEQDSSLWLASTTSFLLTYGFGLALITGLALYQRFRDSQLRFAALERALAATRLAALRMQLSPHTLFNLLHTIRGQIAWDPASAQAMVVQLGDVLRRLLAAGERDFSRLSDELEFVRLYLELQQNRFSDRLTIRMIDLDAVPPLWVPSLILQPLAENAVVHGLAGHAGAVQIRVEAVTYDDCLALRVVNTIAPGVTVGLEGIGLRNVRERLALQFGDRATFHAGAADARSWVAEIRMPLVRDAAESGCNTH